MKSVALFYILLMLSPILILYFNNLDPAFYLVWLWLGLWLWFVKSKHDIVIRGLFFVVISVLLAICGQLYLVDKENKHTIEILSQLFLIIGGGVGGNFMAHHFLSKKNN